MRDQPPDSAGDDRELGGPGWEREHGADHADYLDALHDPDDPLHQAATAGDQDVGIERVLEDGSVVFLNESDPEGKLEALSIAYEAIGELVSTAYLLARDKVRSEDPVGLIEDVLRSAVRDLDGDPEG
jgi:hypothetical protein